ncbi:hypothetical protein Tco_0453210 [Tanacetum coccineum]
MECRVESLMRNEVLLEYEAIEGRYEKKDTFMCLADSLLANLKVKIEAQRAHSIKIEKITRFPTHTPTVTPETLKPTMVHRVSMISKIEPTNYRTPHQYLNSNLKMPLLHSFEENKLEYEDEDAVEIKMMGTGMDKESLEHNLYENDITPIICHNFSLTLNPPIKPKDPGSFRMKVVEPLTIHTPPSPHVAYFHRNDPGDNVATIKRRRHNIHGDGVRDSAMALGRGRLKVDLEPSTWRRGVDEVPDFSMVIAQQLQNLLPTIIAQVGNHVGNFQGDVRNVIVNNGQGGCSYKEFLACNPKNYDGKGGAIAYTRWTEKIELV